MKTEVYEVRVEQAPHTVIAGPSALPPIRCDSREAAEQEFAMWAGMPEGRIQLVELVQITTETIARWPAE